MFNTKRIAATAAMISAAILTLTGCTPPMPPEVRAALAEKTYTCVAGTSAVSVPHAIGDLANGWQDAMVSACPDMSFTVATDPAAAQLNTNAEELQQLVRRFKI